ncbi:MAG: hypothetical protein R3C11_21625 [Planctomycetaceae bacterium]
MATSIEGERVRDELAASMAPAPVAAEATTSSSCGCSSAPASTGCGCETVQLDSGCG